MLELERVVQLEFRQPLLRSVQYIFLQFEVVRVLNQMLRLKESF